MDGFVFRYFLVVPVRVMNRAIFGACPAACTLILDDIPGLPGKGNPEIPRLPFNAFHLGIGKNLDVWVPADLDQFRRKYSHRAVVGGIGLVELGHVAAYRGRFLDQVHPETGRRKIQRSLNAADPATDHHDVPEMVVLKTLAELSNFTAKRQFSFHFLSPDWFVLKNF